MVKKSNVLLQDDFFGDCDDHDAIHTSMNHVDRQIDDQYGELSIRESVATERQYFAIGYHETFDECYDASLQNGFDESYRNNYDTALRLGHLLGQLAITAATSQNSELAPQMRENNGVTFTQQTVTENKLIEVSRKVRSQLLSITQAEASPDTKSSKDDRLQDAYSGIAVDIAQMSTKLVQQQQQKDIEDLIDDVQNIMSVNATII